MAKTSIPQWWRSDCRVLKIISFALPLCDTEQKNIDQAEPETYKRKEGPH